MISRLTNAQHTLWPIEMPSDTENRSELHRGNRQTRVHALFSVRREAIQRQVARRSRSRRGNPDLRLAEVFCLHTYGTQHSACWSASRPSVTSLLRASCQSDSPWRQAYATGRLRLTGIDFGNLCHTKMDRVSPL